MASWHRREHCDHPEPRRVTATVVITDAAGNVRAVAQRSTWVSCEHWERRDR